MSRQKVLDLSAKEECKGIPSYSWTDKSAMLFLVPNTHRMHEKTADLCALRCMFRKTAYCRMNRMYCFDPALQKGLKPQKKQ